MVASVKRDFGGHGAPPARRGCVVCANHLSYVDPLTFAHFLYDNGHPPFFLAKEASSGSRSSAGSSRRRADPRLPRDGQAAEAPSAPRSTRCARASASSIYPEGTLTRDPDLWPMVGKTGAARVALQTGCPVIPVAQWGAAGDPRARTPSGCSSSRARRCTCGPARRSTCRDLHGRPLDRARAAARPPSGIMDAITALLEEMRGETAPRSGSTRAGRPETGDPTHHGEPPRPGGRAAMTQRRRSRHRQLGHGLRRRCSPTPAPRCTMWGAAPGGGRPDQRASTTTADYLPGIALPEPISRHDRPGRGGLTAPTSSCWRCRRRRCAPTSPAGPTLAAGRRRGRVADEGRRARHDQADERGHRRGRGRRRRARIAVVSGPNLAREIAATQPAASVVACVDAGRGRAGRSTRARRRYFRPYTNTDVVGTELGGAVKNVIALAVGMAEGMGMGDNTKASIITRGLAETTRLGVALGADPMTFAGLAGRGRPHRHLHVAAVAQPHLRREPRPGHDAGGGRRASTRQTAEGVKSCESILDLARAHGVDDADHRAGRRGRPRRAHPEELADRSCSRAQAERLSAGPAEDGST